MKEPKQELPVWLAKPASRRRRRPREPYMTPGSYLRRSVRAIRILRGRY